MKTGTRAHRTAIEAIGYDMKPEDARQLVNSIIRNGVPDGWTVEASQPYEDGAEDPLPGQRHFLMLRPIPGGRECYLVGAWEHPAKDLRHFDPHLVLERFGRFTYALRHMKCATFDISENHPGTPRDRRRLRGTLNFYLDEARNALRTVKAEFQKLSAQQPIGPGAIVIGKAWTEHFQ